MKLTLLSYNIHRAIGVDRRFRIERIAEILHHHAADIALLQEVDEGAPRSRELNLAHELAQLAGYPDHALGHNVTLRKGPKGVKRSQFTSINAVRGIHFKRTFLTTGTYHFVCDPNHTIMHGVLNVT